MKLPIRAAVLTIGLGIALGVTFGLAYAALHREFSLPIQATVTVNVASPEDTADLGGNGVVNGADLIMVISNFNTGGDVDQNGTVNIFDLAFLARYFSPLILEPTPTPPPPTPIPPPTSTPTPAPAPIQAIIQNFSHQNLTIPAGSTVIWTNQDGVSHTSTSGQSPTPDGTWNTGNL